MASYAIVIGINDYRTGDRGLRSLNGAIQDAIDIHEWLTTKGGVPEENCYLITSTAQPLAPERKLIDDAIVSIIVDVQTNHQNNADRFYFYYAGHGLSVDNDNENTAMCMADWDEYLADSRSLSSTAYKRKFLAEGLFKEIIIWMDCCRDVKYQFAPGGAPRILPGLGPNRNPRWMVAFGAQYDNQAFEAAFDTPDNEMRGVFTKVLLDGLNGAASASGNKVNVQELTDYLYFKVPEEAQNAGFLQDPEVFHNTHSGQAVYF